MLNDFILMFVLYEKDGNMLAFFIGVHIDVNKLLKCLLSHGNQKKHSHQLVMLVLWICLYYRVNSLIKPNKFLEQHENLKVYWSY